MGKMIKDIPSIAHYVDALDQPTAFDFYRCFACGSLFTRDEEQKGFLEERGACECKSLKYRPSYPVGREWFRWNIVSYVAKLILARSIAPVCERRFPALLPVIGRLVQ